MAAQIIKSITSACIYLLRAMGRASSKQICQRIKYGVIAAHVRKRNNAFPNLSTEEEKPYKLAGAKALLRAEQKKKAAYIGARKARGVCSGNVATRKLCDYQAVAALLHHLYARAAFILPKAEKSMRNEIF